LKPTTISLICGTIMTCHVAIFF